LFGAFLGDAPAGARARRRSRASPTRWRGSRASGPPWSPQSTRPLARVRRGRLGPCRVAGHFLDLRGHLDDWQRTHQAALAAARRAGNRHGEASLLRGLGYLSLNRNRMDATVACNTRSAAWTGWRKLDMPLELAGTLQRLGEAHLDAGSPAAGESACREAVKLLEAIGHPESEQAASRLDHLLKTSAGP
jgi:hypothetical protein